MQIKNNNERGQALVLIVLGIVALLGFTALAIDGGRIYSDRRTMQTASDTSSLSAAASYAMYFDSNNVLHKNFNCAGSWFNQATALAKVAAINRAASNGYSIDADASGDNNGVEVTCFEVSYGAFVDKFIEIDTYITAETPSSFAQFVFGNPLVQTVRSTARIRPQTSLAFGNAIVALNKAGCQGNQNGAQFDGTQDVFVNGGGVLSLGCLGTNGTGVIDVTNGSISYGSEWVDAGVGTENPSPIPNNGEPPEVVLELAPPSCRGLPDHGDDTNGGTLSPGVYGRIRVPAQATAVLLPGLYCVHNGFSVNGQAVLSGAGVTIYMIGGDFNTQGGADVQLTAPLANPDPSPAMPGVLIYMDESNYGEIDLLGDSTSRYQGLVYAPNGVIEVGGSGSTMPTANTQLIGWDIFIHGDTTVDINFLDSLVFQTAPSLDLTR